VPRGSTEHLEAVSGLRNPDASRLSPYFDLISMGTGTGIEMSEGPEEQNILRLRACKEQASRDEEQAPRTAFCPHFSATSSLPVH
jgi:hypothetical protein